MNFVDAQFAMLAIFYFRRISKNEAPVEFLSLFINIDNNLKKSCFNFKKF